MILARPIPMPHDPRLYLLQRDREIPMDAVPRLRELGILDVWVRHPGLGFLEDLIDEELGDRQREVYEHVRRNFESMMRNSSAELDLVHFQDSIGSLFAFLKGSSSSNILLQKLDAFDNYLMSHSTNVCYLALLVGIKLERYLIDQRRFKTARDAKDLHLLGLGCLLHDVGKMMVPPKILNKPARLTSEEMDQMRKHTVYGYDMVKGNLPAPAAEIVLNHHQRWDGSGYPGRVDYSTGHQGPPPTGTQIPVFSRIAMVADVYDAATSKRCYSEAKHPVQVLAEFRTAGPGLFDPVIEAAFFRTVPLFPIGQVVTLSDGTEAVVVDFNPDYPARPKVQCLCSPQGERFENPSLEEINLAYYDELQIVAVDGQDVRPYVAIHQTAEPAAVVT